MFIKLIPRNITLNPIIGGFILILASLCAIIMVNSTDEIRALYNKIINLPIICINNILYSSNITLLMIINNGLMVIFFFVIGLEIKFELIHGTLNNKFKAVFPVIAALGGIVIPAIIYNLVNFKNPIYIIGWAIPTATDIAFATSVLALLSSQSNTESLKSFLLALAIVDDLGAIVIIALFYNFDINLLLLLPILSVIIILAIMNNAQINSINLYFIIGIILWMCILSAGIHANLAGIIISGFIPLSKKIKKLINKLRPWINFLILPVFAFANTGISLEAININNIILNISLPLGIAFGLIFGKPIGILLFTNLAVKLRLAELPQHTNFHQIAAASVLCGIGFTMSILIATIAFDQQPIEILALAKLSIFLSSIISALIGFTLLKLTLN